MSKEIKTIDDLDALDAEFAENLIAKKALEEEPDEPLDEEVEVEHDEEEESDETSDEDGEEIDPVDADEDETPEEPTSKHVKRTPEEKQSYAWKKMRDNEKEAKHAKAIAEQALAEKDAVLTRLMKEAGYSDYNEFKVAVDKQLSAKEMKEKGYTQEQFSEIEQLRKENEQLKKSVDTQNQRTYQERARSFDSLVQKYSKDASTTAKAVYDQLGAEGYTVETLLGLPNPELLIKGLLSDKLPTKEVVKPVKRTVDTKPHHSGQAQDGPITMDDLIKQDMAEYSRRRGV